MDNIKVKALLLKIRNPFFTAIRKQAIADLADDILSDYGSIEELDKKFALFVLLLNKLTL
jgi:hypothetical protein